MEPADAVAFFRGQGIRGGRAEIEAACAPYGYHPLSLRLLAGLIVNDLRQPGDIAAARRLDVSGDLIQRQHHVLEQAYESLTPDRRRLLSRIACFRGPVAYEALAALADDGRGEAPARTSSPADSKRRRASREETRPYDLDADLHDLIARGLLHRDHQTNRFDLHPIVRRYAYDRLAGGDRAAAHAPPARLLRRRAAAGTGAHAGRPGAGDRAVPPHRAAPGSMMRRATLFRDRIDKATYYQFGAYQLQIELLRAPLPRRRGPSLPRLKEESDQAWTLNELANSYSLSGQPPPGGAAV